MDTENSEHIYIMSRQNKVSWLHTLTATGTACCHFLFFNVLRLLFYQTLTDTDFIQQTSNSLNIMLRPEDEKLSVFRLNYTRGKFLKPIDGCFVFFDMKIHTIMRYDAVQSGGEQTYGEQRQQSVL